MVVSTRPAEMGIGCRPREGGVGLRVTSGDGCEPAWESGGEGRGLCSSDTENCWDEPAGVKMGTTGWAKGMESRGWLGSCSWEAVGEV